MQKIHSFLSVIIFLVFSVSQLKAQNLDREIEAIVAPLVASISNQPVKNVAISDFTLLDGTPTELGKYLAEEFSLALVNAQKSFVIIDRSRVTALLKENNLGGSGLIDPNTIAKLGKMKGIDALIAGTMTSTGNTIRLIVKVWNLETQGIIAGNKGDISKTPFIIDLEKKVDSGRISGMDLSSSKIIKDNLVPVGTIISSFLDFHSFCKVNGINEDLNKSAWLPCDGREIRGESAYADAGGSKTPDLRGVFLRGVNEMIFNNFGAATYLQTDHKLNPEQKKVGEYQLSAIIDHTHKFRMGGNHSGGGNIDLTAEVPPSNRGRERTTGIVVEREIISNESRPNNISVYYYIKVR